MGDYWSEPLMAHADVCPCKHDLLVCEGACIGCLTEQYGADAAEHIVRRDGAARSYPHDDKRDDPWRATDPES